MTPRPPINLPPALAPLVNEPRWVLWRWETRNGKRTKPPLRGSAPNQYASSTDQSSWSDLATVMGAYCAGAGDGIGFALYGSEFAAIDLDHARDPNTGTIHPWATALIERIGNCYAEVTPSNAGLRIIGRAAGEPLHRKLNVPNADGLSCELYRRAERYITVSGQQIGGADEQLVDLDAQLDALLAELDGSKQLKLVSGNGSGNGSCKRRIFVDLIRGGCGADFGGDRSRALWFVINELARRGNDRDSIIAVILDRGNRISDHVYDQPDPEIYAARQVDKAMQQAMATAPPKLGKRPVRDILVELACAADLFHAPAGDAYADFVVNGHRETWPVRSKGFRRWLARQYYEPTRSAPNAEAMQAALGIVEARAFYDGPERPVSTRVAAFEDRIYIDLGDSSWQAIEIDEDGWRIVDEAPTRFRRAPGMLALPVPQSGGSVDTLRHYLNLGSKANDTVDKFILVACVLLAYMRPKGPFPVLVLVGEQGTCKSTFAAVLRALIDPNASALRALPREDRDLFITASNSWLLAFDNVSYLPDWISDTPCRIAVGGGFATRQLYSDTDESLFDATRPIILNGIEEFVVRPDLADRAIFLNLEPVPDQSRRAEAELWRAFEQDRAQILGALLDTMVAGLRALPDVELDRMPRMADFARWGAACERSLFPSGAFMAAYNANRRGAVETVLDNDLVAATLRAFMQRQNNLLWTGTAAELLNVLTVEAGDTLAKAKE